MSRIEFQQALLVPRIGRSSGAIAPVAGDFAFSGGFGSTASAGSIVGTEKAFQVVLTSAGTGQGANPTCTFTFPGGAYKTVAGDNYVPVAVAIRGGGSQPTVQFSVNCTATTCVLTFQGTPVAAETYTVNVIVIG